MSVTHEANKAGNIPPGSGTFSPTDEACSVVVHPTVLLLAQSTHVQTRNPPAVIHRKKEISEPSLDVVTRCRGEASCIIT